MPQTILHISDLHRSPDDPISNDELISALVGDRERYTSETPKIAPPNLIVVSGDLIQGVPLGTPDYLERLKEQYETAFRFLDELTQRFVQGDRSRLILVPGNHDVDWNTAFAAMVAVDSKSEPINLAAALFKEGSKYRWDWKNRKLYQIVNEDLYGRRLDSFWTFFERFYQGVQLLRVAPKSTANLFSLFNGRAALAAFNSCEGNDCFSFQGAIRRDAIARTHLDLSGPGQSYDLKIAVWHHSIDGTPFRSDYMDPDVVRGMVGRGFRLGMYGHQHRSQAVAQEIYLPGRERMAVVCAGSLCAGRYELPTGIHRQYNIVEIADDYQSARVHVRAMAVANLFAPGHLYDFGGASFAELNWDPPTNAVGIVEDVLKDKEQSIIKQAEAAYRSGDVKLAFDKLTKIQRPPLSYQRQLYIEVAFSAEEWQAVIEEIDPPITIDELAKKIAALSHVDAFDEAKSDLQKYSSVLSVPDVFRRDVQKNILAKEAMKR